MRLFSVIFAYAVLLMNISGWENDFEITQKKAEAEHKFILLNFSGSDWCGPSSDLKRMFLNRNLLQHFPAKILFW